MNIHPFLQSTYCKNIWTVCAGRALFQTIKTNKIVWIVASFALFVFASGCFAAYLFGKRKTGEIKGFPLIPERKNIEQKKFPLSFLNIENDKSMENPQNPKTSDFSSLSPNITNKNDSHKQDVQPLPFSEKAFWEKVKNFPTVTNEGEPIIIEGIQLFSNLAEAQKDMALSCTRTSNYVIKYLIQSNFQGTVLDLGSGMGANALPLVAKGCLLTVIDKEKEAIKAYDENEKSLFLTYNGLKKAHSIVGDITEEAYPGNMDAIICMDTLPYISPSKLKSTLDKIFQALRPGGQFVGTIFFKPKTAWSNEETMNAELLIKVGGHFYPDKDFAREIITQSGFQIKKDEERWDCRHCLEFLAEKPI